MIVTDKFVFIHLPRTGGTFVSDIIRKFFPSAHELGYHLPRSLLPREYSHLPVLGGVRNPWEFYTSWYHHQQPQTRHSPLFCGLSDNRTLDFANTIQNALNLGVSEETLNRLILELPNNFNFEDKHIPNVTRELMSGIRGTGLGLFTYRFNLMFGKADDVYFCRVESLRQDLLAFFDGIGAANDALRSHVIDSDKKNISEHCHYSTYYTPELAELVFIRDRAIIDRFGYTFEQISYAGKETSIDFKEKLKAGQTN